MDAATMAKLKYSQLSSEMKANVLRAKLAVDSRYDPLLFAEYAWPWYKPGTTLAEEDIRIWQAEMLDTIAQHLQDPEKRFQPCKLAVASGHGIGKSAAIGILSTWGLSCFRDPRILLTANTEGQLRTKTSPEVGQWVRSSRYGDLFDVDTLSIKLKERPEQHRVDMTPWSESNTEAFQGLHAKGRLVMVLMDEASAIPAKIWEVILGAMTDENTILIWVAFGNPTQAIGPFRDCFTRDRNEWYRWNIDSREVEGTNKKALQSIADKYGEDDDITRVRVKGQFPRTSSRQMVPEHLVDAAMNKHLRKDQYDFAPTILTCDPAWTGDDRLVIAKRQGLVFEILEVIPKNRNDMLIGAKIASYEVQHQADAVFIDQGWGTGIWSYGHTLGRDWELVDFGGAATDAGYVNHRAEMYGRGVEWLQAGGVLPPDQELRDDLAAIDTIPRPDGSILLMSKEDIKKKKQLASPDRADAWALSFHRPVSKRARPITVTPDMQSHVGPGAPGDVKPSVYDPFS